MTGVLSGIPGLSIVPPEDAVCHLKNALAILAVTDLQTVSVENNDKNLHAIETRIYKALALLERE